MTRNSTWHLCVVLAFNAILAFGQSSNLLAQKLSEDSRTAARIRAEAIRHQANGNRVVVKLNDYTSVKGRVFDPLKN